MVNRKLGKNGYVDIHLFYQETGNHCFSNKRYTLIKPLLSEFIIWDLNSWLHVKLSVFVSSTNNYLAKCYG